MNPVLQTRFNSLVRARHGLFLANPKDTYIGRALIEYGEYCQLEWEAMSRLLQPGAIVVDAGANIGAFTVPMATAVGPRGRVFAIEPQPLTYHALCANLALNDIVTVDALNVACGSSPDRMGILRPDPATETNFGGLRLADLASGASLSKIRVERLDDLIDPPRLDLIKADIEGMELDLMRGAAGLVARFRPALYLEANDGYSRHLLVHLLDIGYACWWHVTPLFNKNNFADRTDNLFPNLASFNLLCLPEERKIRVEGLPAITDPGDRPPGRVRV